MYLKERTALGEVSAVSAEVPQGGNGTEVCFKRKWSGTSRKGCWGRNSDGSSVCLGWKILQEYVPVKWGRMAKL